MHSTFNTQNMHCALVFRVFLQYGEEKGEDKHVLVNTSQDPHFQWAFSGAGIPEWVLPL